MSWSDFLRWLCTPSAVMVAVGIILSFLVEYWPKYAGLAPKWKRLVFAGLCLVVPILSAVAGALSGVFPWSWEPTFWQAIVAGFAAFSSGTAAHVRKL